MPRPEQRPNLVRVLFLALLAVLAAAAAFTAATHASPMFYVKVWGSPGGGDGQFSRPWDVASAPDGGFYVADRGNHRVQRLSADGGYLGQWGSLGSGAGKFGDDLIGVAVAPGGDVYTLEDRDDGVPRIQRFGPNGAFELSWGTEAGSGLGQFDEPRGIAVGDGGRVYVVEGGNHRVQSFAADGTDPAVFGGPGPAGAGQFADPVAIAADRSDGTIYVADAGGTPRIQAFSPSGSFLRQWGSAGESEGQFPPTGLAGVAVGPEGDVYTRESTASGSRFQRFSPAGAFQGLQYWATVVEPRGIAVNQTYVASADGVNGELIAFDLTTPVAVSVLGPRSAVRKGEAVIFQASALVPLGKPASYEWDLDGDGAYETHTGTVAETTHTYGTPGTVTVGLRVSSDRGGVATAQLALEVEDVEARPPGPDGITINGGDSYTRSPWVTVSVRWPEGARTMAISNDGGFLGAAERPLAASLKWRLSTDGPPRLIRTVYARFSGGTSADTTYFDHIVLDRGRPWVPRARVFVRRHARPRLALRARDKVSGVRQMQIKKRGKKGPWRRYRKSVRLRGKVRGLWVRTRDRAGNRSKWVRAKRIHRGG